MIGTIRFEMRHWCIRNRDKFVMWIAWRLPKRLVMWCAIRVTAHATQGQYSNQIVPDLTAMDAVQRWGVE